MCSPMLAIGAIGAGASLFQQDQQAKAANEAAEIQHDLEVQRAKQEAQDQQNQLEQETLVESQKLSQQRQQLAMEALQEQAALNVGAAEGGAGGGASKIRSFIAAELGEDLARSDIEQNQRNAQFNINQRNRAISQRQGARVQNAFLTRQANSRRRVGALDVVGGVLGNRNIQSGIGGLFTKDKKDGKNGNT